MAGFAYGLIAGARRAQKARSALAAFSASCALVVSCASPRDDQRDGWTGTLDTLASGHVVVHNPAEPIWSPGEEWRVEEELRIGTATGEGPDPFRQVIAIEVDRAGRIWILDGHIMEGHTPQLRVFDSDGSFVRAVARRGAGPGELTDAVDVELAPDGRIWVVDPGNDRVSVFDTAGDYVGAVRALGGLVIRPWPGHFDEEGAYYAPALRTESGVRVVVVRHDSTLSPADTFDLPHDPVRREVFEHHDSRGGRLVAGVPLQGRLRWRLSDSGTIWAIITDQYRLFELNADGDTLRSITRAFTPLPVSDADRERARESLRWFMDRGGRPDWSRLPRTKPPVTGFFFWDETRAIWVAREAAAPDRGRLFDVFDPEGRFLGTVRLPFGLDESVFPVVRDGFLYGLTRGDLDVPQVVKARIIRSAAGAPGAA